jgi:hypothetical protein
VVLDHFDVSSLRVYAFIRYVARPYAISRELASLRVDRTSAFCAALLQFLLKLVLLATCLQTTCLACECMNVERPCEYLRTDAAFVGSVIETVRVKHPIEKNAWTPGYSMRFSVETPVQGVAGKEVQIETGNGGGDCGTPLQPGGKFLVFAHNEKDGKLWTGMCSGNRKLSGSPEDDQIVEQYKKLIKKGSTSIFGHVFHTRPSWQGNDLRNDVEPRPYQGLILRVEANGFTASTKTASDGSYEFSDLPTGRFRVIPELPKSLDFSHEYEENYEAELNSGECAKISFLLQPITRIQGHLLLPPGMKSKTIEVVAVPTHMAKLNQFSGKWAFTDEKDRFDLWPLPPGDYYVGVNINSSPKEDAPFPPTYFPGVTNQKNATVVSVGLGEVKELELSVTEIANPRQVHFVAIGLDGKPLKSIYVQLEDLRHPGDASSYVNINLDQNGAGMLTIYAGYSYHLHGSHWVSYMNDWCAKPVSIPEGTEPVEVKFVMDHKEANCSIDEIDGLRK